MIAMTDERNKTTVLLTVREMTAVWTVLGASVGSYHFYASIRPDEEVVGSLSNPSYFHRIDHKKSNLTIKRCPS